jgi:putative membrane protein (TIGR04086 family)
MKLDWNTVGAGLAVALAVAVPFALVAQAIDSGDNDPGGWVFLLVIGVYAAFMGGGYVAGRRAPDTPLTHGAVAAFGAFVVVQAIGIVRRLVADEHINWGGIVFNGLLSACFGVLGGLIATRRSSTAP